MSGTLIASTLLGGGPGTQIGASLQKGQFAKSQAELQNTNLRERMVQEQIASGNRTIARQDQLRTIISADQVSEVARGVSLASPTFRAITQKSFSAFAEDERADALNLSFKESFLRGKMAQNTLAGDLGEASSILDVGSDLFNLGTSVAKTVGTGGFGGL